MVTPSQEPEKPANDKKPFDFGSFFSNSNARDIVAYVLLILGIILLFFNPIYGGLLIGVVAGIYFSNEIITLIKNLEFFIEREGVARSIVLSGLALAFFIVAPAIFIGAAIAVAIRMFIVTDNP